MKSLLRFTAVALAMLTLLTGFCSCTGAKSPPETELNSNGEETVLSAANGTAAEIGVAQTTALPPTPETTEPHSRQSTVTEGVTAALTEAVSQATTQPDTTAKYERTGESVFSDDPSNKYIEAVASKYNIDTALLAAVYTIPDADGNIVMEFDGTTDDTGRILRNADTLIAIYTVDKSLNSKRASNDKAKNEYSTIEAKTMFFSVTKYIIPKFENELSNTN